MEVLTSADLATDFTLDDGGRRIFTKGLGLVGVGLLAGSQLVQFVSSDSADD